ncbi:hypothetical protein [Dactylosporangium sp. NPDC051541]|uniref:hypothetical protein n=1 Tax=Dactylosporangium sp. NPDC051541 TaxID=3363977 RepID=UPI0037891854
MQNKMPRSGDLALYAEKLHPRISELNLTRCYLCGLSLENSSTSPDHIIPQNIFEKGSGNRPFLPTHATCNNAKSRDDEWFKRVVDLMAASGSPVADASAQQFLDKALLESHDAYVIGAKVRNFRLARRLLRPARSDSLQVTYDGMVVPQISLGEENAARLHAYIASLCTGLFLRNVPDAEPSFPTVNWVQYAQAELTGRGRLVHEQASELTRSASTDGTMFCQRWSTEGRGGPSTVLYLGSALAEDSSRGFVYVQFYSAVGFFAIF